MLVDDDQTNLIVTKTLLEKNGYGVMACKSGTEAVMNYMKNPCPVILMDCSMPNMDGFATTDSIRMVERQQLIPPSYIIALTGKTHTDNREKCKKVGMDEFIPKPFKPQDLIARLELLRF